MAATSTVLHLGLGAFHRAHQLAYMQALRDSGNLRWRSVSANIRPDADDPALILARQDHAYTLEVASPDGTRDYHRITALEAALPYTEDLAQVVAVGAAPATRIVSFTVTEAGYHLDADGMLDAASDAIQSALAATRHGLPGASIYSVLAAILRQRVAQKAGPLTLLCCDNLRHNGRRAQAGLRQFLALAGDADLAAWMDTHTSFPNTMVDRITPGASPALQTRVLAATGREDRASVGCERYTQWVIEDDFCNGRPAWERVGAQLVAAVEPFEEAKIRILNASHSAIAWAGSLAGYRYIHQALRDPRIDAVVRSWITEGVIDCLRPSPIDLERYRDQVLERFAGDAIQDTVERVLADSVAKLPGFVVPTIRDRIRLGLGLGPVAALPALFLRVLLRWRAGSLDTVYRDQARDRAGSAGSAIIDAICAARDPVAAFCAQPLLWDELAGHPQLTQAIAAAMPAAQEMEGPA